MPVAPTLVDIEGLVAYARLAPEPRRATDREVTVVAGRTPRGPSLRGVARPRGAVAARLAELGLVDPVLAAVLEEECASATELLCRTERVVELDTEMLGEVRMDRTAARLAAMTGELRHASFEQIAPTDDEACSVDAAGLTESSEIPIESAGGASLPDDEFVPPDASVVGLARVRAHVGLASWELLAIDRGPWLDLPAILGLLNTILRHQGSVSRLVVLRGHDARARVLAAPLPAIEACVAESLLELESPDDALLRSFDGDDEPALLE